MMKQLLIFIIAVTLSFSGFSQMPGMGKAQAAANIGHIYGRVLDSAGKTIHDATVLLLHTRMDAATKKMKEVLFKGITTKANGDFSFEELPIIGTLKLKISATGFKSIEQNVSFSMPKPATQPAMGDMSQALNAFDKDLGNIKLAEDVNQLQGVVVTAITKPTLKMDIDKKVYNVEKDIVNAGGTALDVMKNVPSVNVDIDGNVTLRNATPQIYIEGRPTTLTLDQIPADAIESVEVITNPSAKYDASGGGAGILNIILKKNRKTGYNGNLRVGVDSYGAINGGADFNIRQGKFNFNASAFVNQNKGKTFGTTYRNNFGDTSTAVHQISTDKDNGGFIFGRVGLDYFMTNRTSFSAGMVRVHADMSPYQFLTTNIDSLLNTGTTTQYSERYANTKRIFNGTGAQFGFKQLFKKEGETLTADMNYFSGNNSNNVLYNTNYYLNGAGSAINNNSQQQTIGTGYNQFLTAQTDYVKPFGKKSKIETGLRFQQQKLTNGTDNYYMDNTSKNFILSNAASINYKNTNNVYAAYASVTSAIKNFGYQIGLRAERSDYSGDLLNTQQHFSNSYPISLFPSVFLSQKFKGNNEVQFSYTRRINRPNFFQLIPYTDYSDSLNITRGNPNLVPEFTSSFELSYLKTLPHNNTFLASLYYKHTEGLITRYLDTAQNYLTGKQDIINTYVNANSSYTVGAELTGVTKLTKWWDMTMNVNIYNSQINTNNIIGNSQAALWSWFGKMNNNFKLPGKFKLQLTGLYQSKTNLPVNNNGGQQMGPPMMQSQSASQGYIRSFYSVDAAISRSFLKNDAATISLSMSDIFRTRYSDQYSVSNFFVQDYNRLRNPQMLRLNFTYRFGKMDVSLFKRKNTNTSGMDALQGVQ
ncbi:MAG: TonB-dependent receptor [Hydrotalea flava]|nr:TonB-dependent receptor [Hydrotalea flava]NIM37182.1 TonB-dependent receptor [Hydrotalea flava]NIN02375.1 TonB-dependent receptor [Hydrotalea flava]NIN14027.1 TonB-dependent receptor [Hydrotalea flava]NIO93108.1 TonB-dependent receptor [Hydrotalea flava]